MSRVSVYNNILVDIGDEQSIAQSLSTFSSHMVNIIDIMKKADDKSLILIDELGAGTDPVEGAALAVSGVTNGCCEFDIETLRPTYKLLIGVPGRSNAFAILAHLGMEQSVIDNAKAIVGSDNRDFEAVLEKLEASRHALEEERKIAEEMTQKAKKIEEKAQSDKDKIETLKAREIDKAKREAQKLIDSAKRKSSEFLLELEKLKKEQTSSNATEIARKTRRAGKAQMGEMDDLINPNELADNWDYDYKLPRNPVAGDRVVIKGIGEGEVVEFKNNNVFVKSGLLKTRVKLSDIMIIDKPKKKPVKTQHNLYRTSSRADKDVKTEIDMRGETVDEAIGELGLFIDRCVLNNIEEIRIIHGKGTGVLRTAVGDYLKTHPNVAEYRLGRYGEGENGVTIAKLK